MQSHRFSTFARIVLVAVVAGAITACAPVRDYHEPVVYYSPRPLYYDYWYYPAIGSYYDPRARTHIYLQHGHWIRARELPARVRPYLGRYVTIRSSHERPYEEHLRHREKYIRERYRAKLADQRDHDVWIGAPNPPVRPRKLDRDTGGERHRNDGRGDGRDIDARNKERSSSDEYGWRK
jgi:hypothetical protein